MPFYSLLVTSCDRDDLLERTITSYLQNVEIKPRQIVICDNGPVRPMPEFLLKLRHFNIQWINEGSNRGQVYACDRLWQECKYDYAMWMEEDWEFQQGEFIQSSFDILEKYPQVLTVTLRGDWNHPLVSDTRFPFKIAQPNWKGKWGGFTFNPGLRRKSDYTKIGSYGRHVGYGTAGLGHEIELSLLYAKMGYVLAAIPDKCTHIGGGRSRAVMPPGLVDPPKVLIAIPACHKFEYGRWESGDSPLFDQKKAWKGEAYGTGIHLSGENPRIQTVRNTWLQDVKHYKNITAKFFYGEGATREPLPDEVFVRGLPDDYEHLPQKTMAICKYAVDNGYDLLFKCDDDTAVYVDRLATEALSQPFDYAGWTNGLTCSGGPGYWLSKRAMLEVVRNPLENHWAEDVTVGRIMHAANIPVVHLSTHLPGGKNHWFFPDGFKAELLPENAVAIHAVQPDVMREWYQYEQKKLAYYG